MFEAQAEVVRPAQISAGNKTYMHRIRATAPAVLADDLQNASPTLARGYQELLPLGRRGYALTEAISQAGAVIEEKHVVFPQWGVAGNGHNPA